MTTKQPELEAGSFQITPEHEKYENPSPLKAMSSKGKGAKAGRQHLCPRCHMCAARWFQHWLVIMPIQPVCSGQGAALLPCSLHCNRV
jgi:hypothetical protein